jgi:hypothetical protein
LSTALSSTCHNVKIGSTSVKHCVQGGPAIKVLHDLSRDAITALGNDHLADLWLNRPSRLFDGMTPAQALDHPTHRTRAMNQLKWFAGINKETLNI